MNLRGQVIAMEKLSMDRGFSGQNEFVEMLSRSVEWVIEQSGVEHGKILGIGVGVPGPVDYAEGVILTPPNMPILNYLPLREILEKNTGIPVFVNKDTNVIAFGEYWCGEARDCSTLVYTDVDMGIGSGLIIDGKLNIGANGIAGEFGHITVDINGALCNCGNRGCLEAVSSGIAVIKELSRRLDKEEKHPLYKKREDLVIEDVFEMAEKKDMLTISILNQSAFYLGVAISNLINILDPEIVILGGILIQRYPRYFDIVKDVADQRKVKGARENRLLVSSLKESAGVIGAGEVVADNFFNKLVNEVFMKN